MFTIWTGMFNASPNFIEPKNECTNNMTKTPEYETLYEVYYTLAISVIAITCLCGNGLVMRCVLTYKNLQTANNYLILSLAFSDALQGVIFPVYNLIHIYEEINVPDACRWMVFLVCFPQLTSAYNLVGLTVLRLLAVYSPLKQRSRTNKKKLYIFISVIWIWCLTLALAIYVFGWVEDNASVEECRYELHYSEMHAGFGLIAFSCVIPAVSMISMYVAIVCLYHKHKKNLQALMQDSGSTNQRNDLINHEFRLAQTAGIMITFFIVTWLPCYVYIYLFTWCRCNPNDCDKKDIPWLRATLRIVSFFNAAVNVFIYAGRNTEIRLAFKKELRKLSDRTIKPLTRICRCRGPGRDCHIMCLYQTKVESIAARTPSLENGRHHQAPSRSANVSDIFAVEKATSHSGAHNGLQNRQPLSELIKENRCTSNTGELQQKNSKRGRSYSMPVVQPHTRSTYRKYRLELSIQSIHSPRCSSRIDDSSSLELEASHYSEPIGRNKLFPRAGRNRVVPRQENCETHAHEETAVTKL